MNLRSSIAALTLISLVSSSSLAAGKGPAYATPEEASQDPDFSFQGEYAGENLGIQVIALSNGQFHVVKYDGGLPGAGWNGATKEELEGNREEISKHLKGLKKVERTSPTLGKKAPAGAIVLFDGTRDSLDAHWKKGATMTESGLLTQGVTSVDTFVDHHLHLEFRLPFMPEARGQARGNSGCYVQGRYEIQMLDSFGLEGKDNECGGIYKASAPRVNMAFPPLTWQTYDIDFTAARFNADGQKTQNARMTVRHNGVVIHDNLEIPEHTPGNVMKGEGPQPGPVFLQNHGDPVRYRNIWVTPKS